MRTAIAIVLLMLAGANGSAQQPSTHKLTKQEKKDLARQQAADAAIAHASPEAVARRVAASDWEKAMLRKRMDVKVWTAGVGDKYLFARALQFYGKSFLFNFGEQGEQGGAFRDFRALGFERLTLIAGGAENGDGGCDIEGECWERWDLDRVSVP
jgi:hypothetical protein